MPFCGACDRLRLTADGQLRNCLFARDESDLRTPLREGATDDEIAEAMRDLRGAGVEILTLGQYLRPSAWHLPVVEYVRPERFRAFEQAGKALGFRYVASGPLVRSSYRAAELFLRGEIASRRERSLATPSPVP